MSRRIALVLLALALVASVATAASSPATSKGKKGKGGSSSSCPNAASCGLATAAQVAALQLYNVEEYGMFTSEITLGSGDACSTTDVDGVAVANWGVTCDEQTAFSPNSLEVAVVCPTEGDGSIVGQVTQFWCEAYVTDGASSIISGLPAYSSGFFGNEAICIVDTSGLADGTSVEVRTAITCSNYMAIAPGAKTAGKPKLSDFVKKD